MSNFVETTYLFSVERLNIIKKKIIIFNYIKLKIKHLYIYIGFFLNSYLFRKINLILDDDKKFLSEWRSSSGLDAISIGVRKFSVWTRAIRSGRAFFRDDRFLHDSR